MTTDAETPDDGTDTELTHGCMACNDTFESFEAIRNHNCTPECRHCGKTFADLEAPEYPESEKLSISAHQRECEERDPPEGPIRDPEAEFRKERRERKRRRQFEAKIERQRR